MQEINKSRQAAVADGFYFCVFFPDECEHISMTFKMKCEQMIR